jgi:hypothetical protein
MQRPKCKINSLCGKNALNLVPFPIYKVIQISDDTLPLAQNLSTAKERLEIKVLQFLSQELDMQ